MGDLKSQYFEELKEFILNHYLHSIVEQINQPQTKAFKTITLVFDLSLIIASRPLLASWVINFYPHFLSKITAIIYSIGNQMGLNSDFICEPQFVSVPPFDTALHDSKYRLSLMEKQCGSLIHMKNAHVISVENPKNYLLVQEFQCQCNQKIQLKFHNLIDRLENAERNEIECRECGSRCKEVGKQYKACQKLAVYLYDGSPYNRNKYANFSKGDKSYKHQSVLLDLYIDGNRVNNFKAGDQVYSLSYYFFKLKDQFRNKKHFLHVHDFCYAITIDHYQAIVNRKYFQSLKQDFRFVESQQIDSQDVLEDIKILMDKMKRHYTYTLENHLFIYETMTSALLISQKFSPDCNQKNLTVLKLALFAGIFLENSDHMYYYLNTQLSKKSNLLVQKQQNEQPLSKHIHIATIFEDKDILIELLHHVKRELDNAIILTDCDEETFDHLVMNLANGGILIILEPPSKVIQQKILKIMHQSPINIFNKSQIKIECSVWWFFDIQDIRHKRSEISSLHDKYALLAEAFDIILDISYSNLVQKQVAFDFPADHAEELFRAYFQSNPPNPYHTTIKKDKHSEPNRAPSSYYLLQKQKPEKLFNKDLEQLTLKVSQIDQQTEELLQRFYLKLRNNCKCPQVVLHSMMKIAQAIAIMRNFIFSIIDDSDGLYKYLFGQGSRLPTSYADGFLAILLVLETRVNQLGPAGAIFGSEVSNFLYNIHNPKVAIERTVRCEIQKEEQVFENFRFLYDKILKY